MATMGAKLFIDTNVLVYAQVAEAPLHDHSRSVLRKHLEAGGEFWISRQVIREFLAVMTRQPGLPEKTAQGGLVEIIRGFIAHCRVADETSAVTDALLKLLSECPCSGRQVHDANIAATMMAHGVPALLTHNTSDFKRFRKFITIVPLK